MIKRIFSKAFSVIVFVALTNTLLAQQHFKIMPVQSGYNADVIANGVGPAMSSTTNNFDGTYYNLVAKDFKLTSTSTVLSYGLPENGTINSAITPGLSFQLGDLSGNNSLRLDSGVSGAAGNSGTLVFATPIAAVKLYMLAASGQGTAYVKATINFTDNTTQSFTQEVPFWNSTRTNYAVRGMGRIDRNTNTLQYFSEDPKLYQTTHNVDVANQTKFIKSITVEKITNEGVANIFAFSADAYTNCIEPGVQPVSAITSSSAKISWTVPAGSQPVSYDIYYAPSPTYPYTTSPPAPTNATAPSYSGVTGTSYILNNLSANTKYYYWVRANCNGMVNQSEWSLSNSFTTLCGTTTPPYTSNFDTFYTPPIITCWNTGSGGTPFTGPTGNDYGWHKNPFMNIYPSNWCAQVLLREGGEVSWLTTPLFDLSAGGYRVKFNYAGSRNTIISPSQMDVDDIIHFMVSNDGGNTWTILKTWDANNNPLNPSNAYADYEYVLTSYISPSTKFAFYASSGTVNNPIDYKFYVDNFTVENITQLGTSETSNQLKNEVKVYPNPFKDVLYIAETKDIKSVSVMDVSGRVVKTIENPGKELQLSELNSGVYLVTVSFKDGSKSTTKAIKR
jgi:hypothetical protein